MRIIKHHKENITLYRLNQFKTILSGAFETEEDNIIYDTNNNGVIVNGIFWSWNDTCEKLGWCDEAEIVTNDYDEERVMTWLNLD